MSLSTSLHTLTLQAKDLVHKGEGLIDSAMSLVVIGLAARVADHAIIHYPTHGEVLTAAGWLVAQLRSWSERCKEDYSRVERRMMAKAKRTGTDVDRGQINQRFMQGRAKMLTVWHIASEVREPMRRDFLQGSDKKPFAHVPFLGAALRASQALIKNQGIAKDRVYIRDPGTATFIGPYPYEDMVDLMCGGYRPELVTEREHAFLALAASGLAEFDKPGATDPPQEHLVDLVVGSEAMASDDTRELGFRLLSTWHIDPLGAEVLRRFPEGVRKAMSAHDVERRDFLASF